MNRFHPTRNCIYLSLYWSIGSFIYALPLILCFTLQTDFTVLTNESLAYRYFAVERIRLGEGGNIWLPQGHLVSALQQALMIVIDQFENLHHLSFRDRLNAFAYLTAGTNILLSSLLFFIAARAKYFSWGDRALILVVILAPVYTAGTNGFYYHLLPDYLALSVCLLGFGIYAILAADRKPSFTYWDTFCVGALLGLMTGNKITLVPPACMIAAATLGRKRLLHRTRSILILLTTGVLALALTILIFYRFRAHSIVQMVPEWLKFVTNPGAEPDFWARISEYVRLYFGYGIAFLIVSFSVFSITISRKKDWALGRWHIVAAGLVIVSACYVFIRKRPAQTTFFEVFCILIFCSTSLIAMLPPIRWRNHISIIVAASWFGIAATTFPVENGLQMLASSRRMADERWAMFNETVKLSGQKRTLVVFPTNEYHHGGVYELLLKASARFPTWNIDGAGQRLLNKYSPNTEFFHEYDGKQPSELAASVRTADIVVWFDPIDLTPLSEKYIALGNLLTSPNVQCSKGAYTDSEGRTSHYWWRCIKGGSLGPVEH